MTSGRKSPRRPASHRLPETRRPQAQASPVKEPRPGASPDGMPPLSSVIANHGLIAKKSLGQNFLLDFNVTRRIARLAAPLEGQTIVEIGPGPGGLTRALLMEGASSVVAIERDERCLGALNEITRHAGGRLSVVSADATKIDWTELATAHPGPKRIVANLPYSVATVLLVQWLEADPWPPWYDRMVLMFQKEVGERIVAKPATKSYGRLAVLAQWRTEPRIVMRLGAEQFSPPPKVDSVVVDFRPLTQVAKTCSPQSLGRVTAAAFGQRRKMLRSSLKSLIKDPEHLLDAAGIAPTARAEDLTVKDFVRLATIYQHARL